MKNLYGVCMIHSMMSQGLSITEIACLASCDRKTVRKYLARDAEAPRGEHSSTVTVNSILCTSSPAARAWTT